MRTWLNALVGIIGVGFGLWAIFKLSISVELTVAFLSLSFGVLAIIWILIAKYNLSPGSALRKFTTNFLVAILFLLAFTLIITVRQLQSIIQTLIFVEHFFITATFLLFVIAAYQILHIGKQFGFERKAKTIKKILKK